MRLTPCFDPTPFAWIGGSDEPWDRLVTWGPAGFEAYARLRFVVEPDSSRSDDDGIDADLSEDLLGDLDHVRRALQVLAAFTGTPKDCFFAVWEGYSDVPLTAEVRRHLVEVPNRRFALFGGPLAAIDDVPELGSSAWAPAFVWPADHAWCVASDVDPDWAGIGASRAAIGVLLATPDLDVVPADPTAPAPVTR